jgi:hypothetical protein
MNKKELEAFAREAAKGIKTEKDLSDFSQMLTKITVETALSALIQRTKFVSAVTSRKCYRMIWTLSTK